MYSIGETFSYEIDDEEINFTIIGDIIIKGKEYLVANGDEGTNSVFYFNDLEEEIEYIDDEDLSDELIKNWEEEYYGTINEVGLWEEDYDSEEDYEDDESYFEENFVDEDNDLDSYIDDLMDDED